MFFVDKNPYVKFRGIIYLSECKIKKATPFIISTVGTMETYPEDYLEFLTIVMKNRFSADENTNFNLLSLWKFSNPQQQQKYMSHYSSKQFSDFWNSYYLSHKLVNYSAGYGDSASLGGTTLVRKIMGWDNSVDYDSGAYLGGEITDIAFSVTSFSISWKLNKDIKLLTSIEKNKLRDLSTKTIIFKTLKKNNPGCEIHHIQPLWRHKNLKGYPKVGTLFPTGNLPTWINSNKFNLKALKSDAHNNAHISLMNEEKIWGTYHSPFISGLKIETDTLDY